MSTLTATADVTELDLLFDADARSVDVNVALLAGAIIVVNKAGVVL